MDLVKKNQNHILCLTAPWIAPKMLLHLSKKHYQPSFWMLLCL